MPTTVTVEYGDSDGQTDSPMLGLHYVKTINATIALSVVP